jgi:hypothetical protein
MRGIRWSMDDYRRWQQSGAEPKPVKPNKYNAKKTEVDGIVFDSKKEAARYSTLKILQAAGKIDRLDRQVEFELFIHHTSVGFYRADFVYTEDGKLVVEDVKGKKTDLYQFKKKVFEVLYNVKIRET